MQHKMHKKRGKLILNLELEDIKEKIFVDLKVIPEWTKKDDIKLNSCPWISRVNLCLLIIKLLQTTLILASNMSPKEHRFGTNPPT